MDDHAADDEATRLARIALAARPGRGRHVMWAAASLVPTALVVTASLGMVALAALFVLAQLRSLEAVVLAFGLGIPLLVALAWALLAGAGDRLIARADGLRDVSPMRGPLGVTFLVRGRAADGRGVRVFAARVEIDLDGRPPLAIEYTRAALEQIAREVDATGRASRAASAARKLVWLGARGVVVGERAVTVRGRRGCAADLVAPAVALALAPARVRLRARAADGSCARAAEGATCPYCRSGFERVRDDAAVRCSACDVRQHTGCWQAHGGCAVFRCRRAPAGPDARAVRVDRIGRVITPDR